MRAVERHGTAPASGEESGGSEDRRNRITRRRALVVAIMLAVGVLGALVVADLSDPDGREAGDVPRAGGERDEPQVEGSGEPLTWRPPQLDDPETIRITEPGRYDLHADQDYVIEAPERIAGPVHLRGGGDIVWVGGHITIPDQGAGPVDANARRGLMITDMDDERGDVDRYGQSPQGRTVHIEGLLIDGPDLSEGVNTNAPTSIVQLQNVHVDGVGFRNADDRDGTGGWDANHPDIIQTWGSQAELRIDGLTGASAYQGIFLKEDHDDRALGPVLLRRVDITAIRHEGTDGMTYTGHRMFAWYPNRVGPIRIDNGSVFVSGHAESGWVRADQNPAEGTSFWRERFRDEATGELVDEPPPGDATFSDALGEPQPDLEGEDERGDWAGWSQGPTDWDGDDPGRIYRGSPPDGPFVPAESVGLDYRSPGYLDATD